MKRLGKSLSLKNIYEVKKNWRGVVDSLQAVLIKRRDRPRKGSTYFGEPF